MFPGVAEVGQVVTLRMEAVLVSRPGDGVGDSLPLVRVGAAPHVVTRFRNIPGIGDAVFVWRNAVGRFETVGIMIIASGPLSVSSITIPFIWSTSQAALLTVSAVLHSPLQKKSLRQMRNENPYIFHGIFRHDYFVTLSRKEAYDCFSPKNAKLTGWSWMIFFFYQTRS